MASSFVPNVDSSPIDSGRKKRRKISGAESPRTPSPKPSAIRWKSDSEQRIYSSKLVEALRHSRRSSGTGTVRETADRVLAATAKGTTRWSRAILTSRHSLLMNRLRNRKVAKKKVTGTGTGKSRSTRPEARRRLPAVQRKVKVLGRLVPGCRKIPFQNLLEETTDYISALQMQIRAMNALAGLLAGSLADRAGPSVNASS